MSYSKPTRPSTSSPIEKPYELVSFPNQQPPLNPPAGHDRFQNNRLHGKLELKLKVRTAVHISTGIVAMGSDVGSRVPLIKTMAQGQERQLTIPGSSLKGVVRSIYEAITNSTLAVVSNRYKQKVPRDRLPCRRKDELCPASQVFGALDWQGLVHFTDAKCNQVKSATGFMPSLYRPRPEQRRAYFKNGQAVGRKFYYHAIKEVSGGDRGIPVQQAGAEYTFSTHLYVMNLSPAELGTLLISLGQDTQYPMALKVGGGKPIGMGTMTVEVTAIERTENKKQLRDRYSSYVPPESDRLTGDALAQFIQQTTKAAKDQKLIQEPQLRQLAAILEYPTTRTAPEGMY